MLDHSRLMSKQHSDGGWGLVPIQSRAGRFSSYDVADFEPVTTFDAEWKYTPIKSLGALLDGELDGSRYDFTIDADGVTAEWAARTDARIGSVSTPEERGSANAWTRFQDALVITVTGDEPVRATVARSALGTTARAAHTIIDAKPNSNGIVILDNSGEVHLSENVEISVGDGARLTVVSVQDWAPTGIHLATHFAKIGRDAFLKHVVVSLDGSIVRVNTNAHLVGEGGDVELLGVYFADAGQHFEQQVFIDHDAPHTKSRSSYRGALQGQDARAVWIGDVLIRPSAPGTDSYEENRNLLLTEGTRADSVPNLEIETGDIAGAGHASASGRFDDEQLFYLQSRGMPEEEARRLVVRAFLSAIIQKIGVPEIQERLEAAIEAELRGSAS
ncbi:Fe-S cluster assembly protein SufD [Terrimesophilobacter mesophilus]|uniref:Fe-S cluster assembly protein SufD n=1 Tax=Terrimesophilobacter mesophilus TaxID=433647 RepID=A0A4R8VBP3_9MICO|nr:Fe-S cluster assembly protein SufD [Terrimesophilobacter mesophilus]TFB80684.1 Fe-S cluster assembly protein SufD [Terrimesophilobacter mesophilus]